VWQGEFRHPRLARVYDARFGWTGADDFFVEFANAVRGRGWSIWAAERVG